MQPKLVLQSLEDCFQEDSTTQKHTKEALREMVGFCLDESYVTYKGDCYQSKKGIPTGGCNSRQLADIFLHWLLFRKIDLKHNIKWNIYIKLWKRFIDDCLGLWKGTKCQFDMFVTYLNQEASKFGIYFAESLIGEEVNFLDVRLYIRDKKIYYTLYVKPTDSRRYLRTNSFHPQHTFDSVPLSQIMRVIKRCSSTEEQVEKVEQLKLDMMASGYSAEKLSHLEYRARKIINTAKEKDTGRSNQIVFSVKYFQEIGELRTLLHDLSDDISWLIGKDTRILMACRKGFSIGASTSASRKICLSDMDSPPVDAHRPQACSCSRCLNCGMMFQSDDVITVNNLNVPLTNNVNCKSDNVIYLLQCTKCPVNTDNSYFGQTRQGCHNRMNGHRSSFHPEEEKYEKSAAAIHAYTEHDPPISFQDFKCGIVKKLHHQ